MYENDRSQSPVEDMMQQEQTQNQRSVSRSRSRSPVRRSSRSNSRSRSPRRDERHRDRARRINLISKRIIISNIPYEMKWQDIKDIFRKEVGDVTYVELFENTTGKSKGQGVIEFKDKDTARKAIENMHRYKIKDRNIVVREERESDRNMIGRGVMGSGPAGGGGGGGGMGMGGGMMGNVGGLSPQVLSQLGIDGPITNTVFVSNLDYKITWKKLKDVFRLAGNVTRAEIKEDKDGKSRGMGTVTFETNFESVQAVSMFNGQSLYDRSMRVKMDSLGADKSSSAMPLPSGLRSIGAGLGPGGTPMQNQTNMGFSGSQGMGMSGMGGGMGSMGNMGGNSMGGMGMDSMGMGNMGMSNMGTGMGSNSMGGMGMNNMGGSGNYGGSSGMGMNNMGSTGMGMGNMSGMSDNYNSMGSSGFSSGMSGGMGDGMRGMSSNNMTSAYSTGISDMGSMGNSGYGSGSRSGNNYGMSSSSYSSSSRNDRDSRDSGRSGTRPDNCTVVCKNLPWKVTWQDLKEKFRAVGDVKFAEIKMENGKSQGWGLVRFGNAEDAQQAISLMNRTRLDGREIDVKLYR